MFEVGDKIESRVTGRQRIVTRITPAGALGTSHRDGPTFHATVIDWQTGAAKDRGHTAEIWSKSISYPTSDWKIAED